MSYLAIARSVVTGYERNEFHERSQPLGAISAIALDAADERNEFHERSPIPEVASMHVAPPSPRDVLVPRGPVTASVPPAGWDGRLCRACPWPAFCGVLGPRGPHLPGGPCAAWPIGTGGEVLP
jgi:hypothetical protein